MNSDSTLQPKTQNWPSWNLFIRFWALSTIALFALTWKLWGTGVHGVDFPSIPLFEFLNVIPAWANIPLSVVVVSSLFGIFAVGGSSEISRFFYLAIAFSLLLLFLLNQHRLQPWAYQACIFSTLFALMPSCVGGPNHTVTPTAHRKKLLGFLKLIIASIYIYSAISKFDYQFIHSTGESFLATLMSWLGVSIESWPPTQKAWAVASLPIGELLIGIGLLIPKLQRVAAIAAVALHATLILLLNELGHHWAVLAWNLQFAILVTLLFWAMNTQADNTAKKTTGYTGAIYLGLVLTLAVVLAPLLKPIGWCDHWLAWGLYSPSNSRVEMQIPETKLYKLPIWIDKYLKPIEPQIGVYQLDLGAWSLDELGVPIYPQARFQTAVAEAVIEQYELGQLVKVEVLSESDRWTGERKTIDVPWREK